jgi:hypothetical protein
MGEISMSGSRRAASLGWRLLYAGQGRRSRRLDNGGLSRADAGPVRRSLASAVGERGERRLTPLPPHANRRANGGRPRSGLAAFASPRRAVAGRRRLRVLACSVSLCLAYNLPRLADESGTHELRNGCAVPAVPDFLSSRLSARAGVRGMTASARSACVSSRRRRDRAGQTPAFPAPFPPCSPSNPGTHSAPGWGALFANGGNSLPSRRNRQ